ncbi:GntR family transcriptional regulator [Bifidobacterium callimiconis]|uniref:GntR family transcriptional regulator n=1 Tax=Bifidobacterium callimiconis TaxID=2306973 RepID=UPI001BDC9653|nr:GntR family transcriptional regulator [Bifidobacterium callimiconis]MBT1178012.1 GntR family transcriptional regulator [Bifidobacterium callimiconis]
MSIFQTINEVTKTDLITDRLTQAIESGLLKNGERLPGESEMARMFGVAPITTREALEQLRSRGLVETRRGRDGGSFVTSDQHRNFKRLENSLAAMSTMDLKNHRALYIALVSSSARIATEEASDSERTGIRSAIESLVTSLNQQTPDSSIQECLSRGHQEMQIHTEIAAATGSSHLVNTLIHLQEELRHLLWIRFADSQQVEFLAKQYAYAAHLLETWQNQLFERRITDIVIVGFSWLAERRIQLLQERFADGHSPKDSSNATTYETPLEISHQIRDLFNEYGETLRQWELKLTERSSREVLSKQQFDELAEQLTRPLLQADRLVVGAGLIPSPDFLPNAPWHSSWWTSQWPSDARFTEATKRNGDAPIIQPLRISDNPQSASFYDFTAQDWWQTPRNTDGLHITGPYFDYICANKPTLTLSRPFYVNRNFAGVAGLDLDAGSVEQRLDSMLLRLERPAAVISNENRVIASTRNTMLCGDLVRDVGQLHAKAIISCGVGSSSAGSATQRGTGIHGSALESLTLAVL